NSPVIVYDYWGGQNQQFQFTPVGSGSRIADTTNDLKPADDKILLFPNPADDILTLTLPEGYISKSAKMEVFNAVGQVVSRKSDIESVTQKLDVSDLSRGVYLIKISNGTDVVTRKFVKK